ncbi:aKG-HExxH-type peptide beta-hydroxylase [Rhodopirellula sp. MGV]|uniref:aKG-HExxH-type peptide beta-hydroxylase n=1 Tax=Rhodopirellula sp. MGV TaxID=2023130 RepID=UPI001304055D|nr:HEXXH motif-containing putative peptide modification protein [Rhodopirellula sp. MGV]
MTTIAPLTSPSDSISHQTPDWVWESHSILNLKYQKTVATLSAIRKALLQRGDLTAIQSRYCEQIDWVLSLPDEIADHVLTDPQAYFFARTAYDLFVSAYLGTELPRGTQAYIDERHAGETLTLNQQLGAHLERFGRFVVSLALTAKQPTSIAPLRLNLPEILPGTAYSFAGSCDLVLHGTSDSGNLELTVNGTPTSLRLPQVTEKHGDLTIHVAPQVGAIRLQPPAFNVAGLSDIRSVVPADVDAQSDYQSLLDETIRLIGRYAPDTAAQLTASMRVIAFKPLGFDGVFNTSCSRLPGAAIFTGARCSLMLADDLIHEFYHNRLFAIEEQGGFFVPADESLGLGPDTVYSPWRDDPRPIYGLLHAVYVFERVLEFWLSAIESGDLSTGDQQFAAYRAAKLAGQLELSLDQLIAWGEFTERGQQLCASMAQSIKQQRARCEALHLGEHTPAITLTNKGNPCEVLNSEGNPMTVGEELQRHIETYDIHHRISRTALAAVPSSRLQIAK